MCVYDMTPNVNGMLSLQKYMKPQCQCEFLIFLFIYDPFVHKHRCVQHTFNASSCFCNRRLISQPQYLPSDQFLKTIVNFQ